MAAAAAAAMVVCCPQSPALRRAALRLRSPTEREPPIAASRQRGGGARSSALAHVIVGPDCEELLMALHSDSAHAGLQPVCSEADRVAGTWDASSVYGALRRVGCELGLRGSAWAAVGGQLEVGDQITNSGSAHGHRPTRRARDAGQCEIVAQR
eukprot:CAMPEP_0182527058 /NCGR_PEP_ID=MMETSP1323-20130603/3613_1 /TAXON_ID=236787 /ORGANISM="Florenciella parvula, Strain RCC1693" /LENGTH=153 /DNA_ID=CAMNT_0024736011 /DNA_START=8 /DNA_END=465 /DNA_ORIENTATION=+